MRSRHSSEPTGEEQEPNHRQNQRAGNKLLDPVGNPEAGSISQGELRGRNQRASYQIQRKFPEVRVQEQRAEQDQKPKSTESERLITENLQKICSLPGLTCGTK